MRTPAAEEKTALVRVLATSWFVRLWYLPVWGLLGVSRLAILLLEFRRLVRILGMRVEPHGSGPNLNRAERQRAGEIGRVIRSASCRTPWKSNCLTQAVTARVMLGLHGLPCVVIFGVAKYRTNGQRLAHAWVESGRVRVTGGHRGPNYVVLGSFGSRSRSSAQP